MSQIQSTTDYDKFQEIVSNREVDDKHVKHLVASIRERNLLAMNPILVNSDHEVIDGQHRLAAAKLLQLPIFYVVADDVRESDIQRINSHMKNWGTMDYINYWTVKKQPGFNILSSMIAKHSHIPLSSMMQLLSSDFKRDVKALKNGYVDISCKDVAEEVIAMLRDFRNIGFEFAFVGQFITAVAQVNEVEGYEHAKMLRKIEMQPRSLVKCVNVKQYKRMLEEIYNYREHTKLRFL